ncbi:hypothetical protein AB0N20_26205 [Streptomyces griseoincarnatus]
MPSSPHHPAPPSKNLSGTDAEDLQLWPVLRTLVGRTVRTVWEDAFAQLASRTQAAA